MVNPVLIGSNVYDDNYADVETADDYLSASVNALAWRALEGVNGTSTKGRAIVTTTRILNRQRWKSDYDTFAERVAVPNIVYASIEMANALVNGSDLEESQNQSQKIQNLKAGSVSLTFFRGAEGASLRFPLIVTELLRDYLAGPGLTLIGKAFGTDGVSVTEDDFGFSEGI